MENVRIAKICGLCAGCKRAISCAQAELGQGKDVIIFKEIVHNDNVNSMLTRSGAKFVENIEDLKGDATVIIRAHGEPPQTYEYLNNNNITYKDCTCPNVVAIHNDVREYSENGYKIVILGKYHKQIHPEVLGTMGWVDGDAILVEDENDLTQLNDLYGDRVYLVCQTTFNIDKANSLIDHIQQILNDRNCELVINRSMCNAQRQINKYSLELAKQSDVMIVVGGKKSSNSLELYKNVSTACRAIFIDKVDKYREALLDAGIDIDCNTKIGITAGASTMREELEWLKQIILNDITVSKARIQR